MRKVRVVELAAGFCHPHCETIEAFAILGAKRSSFVLEGLLLQKMLPEGLACVRLETFHQLREDSGSGTARSACMQAGGRKKQS